MSDIKNYAEIKRFSFRYRYFAYLDLLEYVADGIFRRMGVDLRFVRTYSNSEGVWAVVMVKVRKEHVEMFMEAMEEMAKSILIRGHAEYYDKIREYRDIFPQNEIVA